MSKPTAIFQFGPNSTRYEIRSPKCPHCQKAEAWNPCATGLNFPRKTGKPSTKVTAEVCDE